MQYNFSENYEVTKISFNQFVAIRRRHNSQKDIQTTSNGYNRTLQYNCNVWLKTEEKVQIPTNSSSNRLCYPWSKESPLDWP